MTSTGANLCVNATHVFGRGVLLLTLLPPFWQGLSHLNPIVYMISGFRYGFLGINDVPLVTTFGVLVVFIVAFYLICWSLIQRGRGLRS